ncbi:MAG: CDGSH iron-sulfur domain-containing protein [Acidimicrobiales bacterium]
MANQEPIITPLENGPFRLEGVDHITRWRDGQTIPLDGTAMLCRCGGSSNKPFCDGTHMGNGFSGEKAPDRVPDHRDAYTSSDGRLTIHDNRGLCAHAGYCTDNLASVFRLRTEPFVDADGATAEEIAAVIGMCPSGALSYTLDGVDHRDRNDKTGVAYPPGGPYVLTNVSLAGVEMPDGATEDHCTLCRCGASQNKPFCSGAHWTVDFDEDAVGE